MAAVTCALTPAYTVRWKYGFYPTTLLEHAVLLTLLVFAIETIRQRSRLEWRTPFTWPAALLLLAGAISVVVAPSRRDALGLYRAYFVEPIAFFFVLGMVLREARRAFLVLAGLGVATLVVGLANAVVVIQAILAHRLDLAGTPPVVIYQTQNAVALFLLPVIAVAASILAYGRERRARLACAAYLVLTVPSFLLTLSRGGYLALLGVGVGLALASRRRRQLLVIAVGVTIIFALIPPIMRSIRQTETTRWWAVRSSGAPPGKCCSTIPSPAQGSRVSKRDWRPTGTRPTRTVLSTRITSS